ncbi:hypothetical protein BZA05DRAFT_402454 [Tricharina praecox]|uniref:uncharacterized protein n=1 Tax=Tricharina praecox TaxID=43433 RepID=UPI00221FADE8|nr:uncharacterized protein BZA05DRAFT_402454 [Tricharina praecox]KAI5849181.1 hypothetical protein BZA05DRAFT_402454 [Tricharina praecox]
MTNIFAETFKLDTNKPQTLSGRVAIVTGATRGIGLEIALALSSLGCSVIGTYNTSTAAAERLTQVLPSFTGVSANILTPEPSIAQILAALGGRKVDILVNNAGLSTLSSLSAANFAETLMPTLTANTLFPALLVSALLPHFSTSGTGRIINISSEGSHLGRPNTTAYSASKAALESMTRTWAVELGQKYGGMTVNALALGMMRTDLYEQLPKDRQEFWEAKAKQNPAAPRLGVPNDVAGVIEFLVSPGAAWVTGQVLAVGGGNLMMV